MNTQRAPKRNIHIMKLDSQGEKCMISLREEEKPAKIILQVPMPQL